MKPCVECAFPLWCASVFIDGPLAFELVESFGVLADPWALQTAVQIKTDPLLQVRKRFALSRPVRRAGFFLRELQ